MILRGPDSPVDVPEAEDEKAAEQEKSDDAQQAEDLFDLFGKTDDGVLPV
jgi:hypothetical protein